MIDTVILFCKRMFNKNKVMTIGTVICLALSFWVALYSLNFLLKVVVANADNTVTVSGARTVESAVAGIDKIAGEDIMNCYFTLADGNIIGRKGTVSLMQGRPIAAPDEVLVGVSYGEYYGKQIEYKGKIYNVVGQVDHQSPMAQLYLSEEALDASDEISGIELQLGLENLAASRQKLVKEFGGENIEGGDFSGKITTLFMLPIFYILVLMIMATVLSVALLLRRVSECLAGSITLLRFNGFSKRHISTALTALVFFGSAAIFIAASILYWFLDAVVFPDVYIFMQRIIHRLSVWEYLLTFLAVVALLILSTAPGFKKIVKKEVKVDYYED